jgi:hypothetical protein
VSGQHPDNALSVEPVHAEFEMVDAIAALGLADGFRERNELPLPMASIGTTGFSQSASTPCMPASANQKPYLAGLLYWLGRVFGRDPAESKRAGREGLAQCTGGLSC